MKKLSILIIVLLSLMAVAILVLKSLSYTDEEYQTATSFITGTTEATQHFLDNVGESREPVTVASALDVLTSEQIALENTVTNVPLALLSLPVRGGPPEFQRAGVAFQSVMEEFQDVLRDCSVSWNTTNSPVQAAYQSYFQRDSDLMRRARQQNQSGASRLMQRLRYRFM